MPKTETLKIGKSSRLSRDLEVNNKNQVLELNSQGYDLGGGGVRVRVGRLLSFTTSLVQLLDSCHSVLV